MHSGQGSTLHVTRGIVGSGGVQNILSLAGMGGRMYSRSATREYPMRCGSKRQARHHEPKLVDFRFSTFGGCRLLQWPKRLNP